MPPQAAVFKEGQLVGDAEAAVVELPPRPAEHGPHERLARELLQGQDRAEWRVLFVERSGGALREVALALGPEKAELFMRELRILQRNGHCLPPIIRLVVNSSHLFTASLDGLLPALREVSYHLPDVFRLVADTRTVALPWIAHVRGLQRQSPVVPGDGLPA